MTCVCVSFVTRTQAPDPTMNRIEAICVRSKKPPRMTENDTTMNGDLRTLCDDCGRPLYDTEGHGVGHGSYCDHCAQPYRYVDTDTGRSAEGQR